MRSEFARRLSLLYAEEVPAYATLVEVCQEINAERTRHSATQLRLGSLERVTAERHGAIRVGTAEELRQVGRIFAAMGMHPVGFYDLRDTGRTPVPVVSTAFRPIDPDELAVNPFRVFTSVLTADDRRFFDARTQDDLERFLAARTLFSDELLGLAERAVADLGLAEDEAQRFLDLATGCFALSEDPVDERWYRRLEAISSVAADIGGVSSTHINHLTPRVLDIDELYGRMSSRGIEMISEIQGPPAWSGPEVLLRQTSFRALAESRLLRNADGTVVQGSLRVRFGEVEARGLALTEAGRDRLDQLDREVATRLSADPSLVRTEVAAQLFDAGLPHDEQGFLDQGLAWFRFAVNPAAIPPGPRPQSLPELVAAGWLVAEPIVYEDFLPRSAAGIFQSNLTGGGSSDTHAQASPRDIGWLREVLGTEVANPDDLYAAQSRASAEAALAELDAACA
ncbi:VOC family protein [Jatrophihabitans telluris]|uniref:2-oxoadipate dioxygenase/decarboxylase n=1 Tax=Jatrophihabitans telluris TaxID=2038343 RepID=A0ABY4QWL4_9ACTN|nr:VOC family protein [Jatrophihabitans telluris]UQX87733.1 VOC family protein [Jatrophihabitans telluris]